MTAVARMNIDGYPFLFGDALLSTVDPSGSRDIVMPTVGKASSMFPEGSGTIPTGLCQKIAIVNDDLAIGWAGNRINARILIKELKTLGEKARIKPEELERFFREYDPTVWQSLQLTGYLFDGSRVLSVDVNSSTVGDGAIVSVIGSGGDHILRFDSSGRTWATSPLTKAHEVVATAVGRVGALFADEMFRLQYPGHNLYHFYGGAYEVATLIDSGFKKIGDVTYLFHNGQTDGIRAQISDPVQAIKIIYCDDIMVIRSDVFGGKNLDQHSHIRTTFVIDPVYRTSKRSEWEPFAKPSLASTVICQMVTFSDRQNHASIVSSISFGKAAEENIRIIEDDTNWIRFDFHKDYLKNLADKLKAGYEAI